MIYEWKPAQGVRNYGDALGEIVAEALDVKSMDKSIDKVYFPIGSVISNEHIEYWVKLKRTPVFIGCGWRGTELDPELVKKCAFIGVRGPITANAVEACGLDRPTVTGDSAYIAFDHLAIDAPTVDRMGTLLVPHITSKVKRSTTPEKFGVDRIVLPRVITRQDTVDMVKTIAMSEFVLAGAMHAAITAHAFGVPFAPFNPGNEPKMKWYDWFESIGVPRREIRFCKDYQQGYEWYKSISQYL